MAEKTQVEYHGSSGQYRPMPRDFLQPSADPLVLYPFRFRDPVSGKWVRARYVVEHHEIVALYPEGDRRTAGRGVQPAEDPSGLICSTMNTAESSTGVTPASA